MIESGKKYQFKELAKKTQQRMIKKKNNTRDNWVIFNTNKKIHKKLA